jgi:putative flippase GtrA
MPEPPLKSPRARPLRYLIIGAFCAAAHNIVMIGADWIGLHYIWSTTASFLLVTPVAFWLHSRFTFGAALSWRNLQAFALGVAAGFPLSVLVMAVLCSGLDLPVLIAAPVATVILFSWNYVSARFAIIGRLPRRSLG